MNHWLVKSEPDDYAFADLVHDGRTPWTGVRNYQARNFMRDGMQIGDRVLFYHSGGAEPGVVGVARVASAAYPDPSQFDGSSAYFDPKATREAPRWQLVDLEPVRALARKVTLTEMRERRELTGMRLLQRGNRLSVMPVTESEFRAIEALASSEASD